MEKLTLFLFNAFAIRSLSASILLSLPLPSESLERLVACFIISRSFSISVSSRGFAGLPTGRLGFVLLVDGDSSGLRFLYVRFVDILSFIFFGWVSS